MVVVLRPTITLFLQPTGLFFLRNVPRRHAIPGVVRVDVLGAFFVLGNARGPGKSPFAKFKHFPNRVLVRGGQVEAIASFPDYPSIVIFRELFVQRRLQRVITSDAAKSPWAWGNLVAMSARIEIGQVRARGSFPPFVGTL